MFCLFGSGWTDGVCKAQAGGRQADSKFKGAFFAFVCAVLSMYALFMIINWVYAFP